MRSLRIAMFAGSALAGLAVLLGCTSNAAGPSEPAASKQKTVQHAAPSWADAYHSIGEMSRNADAIVIGTVRRVRETTTKHEGMLFTDFDVAISKWISTPKGASVSPAGEVIIHQTGGTLGAKTLIVDDDPLLKVGEQNLLFLRQYAPGRFFIMGGPTGRVTLTNGTLAPLPDGAARDGLPAKTTVVVERIKAAVQGAPDSRSSIVE